MSAESSEDNKEASQQQPGGGRVCPHCGHLLSPWQQILLNIDRALVCKNCWYRIIFDISDDADTPPPKE